MTVYMLAHIHAMPYRAVSGQRTCPVMQHAGRRAPCSIRRVRVRVRVRVGVRARVWARVRGKISVNQCCVASEHALVHHHEDCWA